ncbi:MULTISPECIES: 30S ribosomal protein S20 [Kushneria]|uniref:Small ribosomal subunit protein bS20 n=2 Tax=Kushneria TaxID=504090 RepID=A0A240UN28_9GAMM|nr:MULTISPECIES: 30S ribosomal protein S20 [Kushneria]ARS53098.1 30S ribosomal protein S20 [Kushneria konosiri]ART62536.1 30S ribosomal protein S20 [Kushneria marisflavi]RKD84090.1 SSU ribosomal protein S20P [Kushneria marisflavi]
MANTRQARKRAVQSERRRQKNASQRSMVRTHIKRVLKAINTGDHSAAMAEFRVAQRVIDRIADKHAYDKNRAARTKSRLNARIKALAA